MSVAWPCNTVKAKAVVPCKSFDYARVLGQYLGHQCPSDRNRRFGLLSIQPGERPGAVAERVEINPQLLKHAHIEIAQWR